MTRVDHLFRLAVFGFSLFLFELDDVETKLALNHVANLAGFQGVGLLLEFGNHIAVAKPTEIAAFIFTAVSGELLRQLAEVFSATSAFKNFLSRGAIFLVGIEFRMAREVSVNFLVGSLHLL